MNAGAHDQWGGGNREEDDGGATLEKAVLGVATCGLTQRGLVIKFFPSGKEGFLDRGTNPSGASGKMMKCKALRGARCGHGTKGAMGKGGGVPVRMDWAMGGVIFFPLVSQHEER